MTSTPEHQDLIGLHVYPSHQAVIGKEQVRQRPGKVVVFPYPGLGITIGNRIKFEWCGYLTDTTYRKEEFLNPITSTTDVISHEISDNHIKAYRFIKTRFIVLPEDNDTPLYTSEEQRFDLIDDHDPSEFLEGPQVPDAAGATLIPGGNDPRGVGVEIPYAGLALDDECLLFSSIYLDGNRYANTVKGQQADQEAVDNKCFKFWLSSAWLEEHQGRTLKLEYQITNRSGSKASKHSEFTLAVRRYLPAPKLEGSVNTEINAIALREGARLQIPEEAEIENCTVLGCVANEDGTLLNCIPIIKTSSRKQPRTTRDYVLPTYLFSHYLGERLVWYYLVSEGAAYQASDAIITTANMPPLDAMPFLQCTDTHGKNTLSYSAIKKTTELTIKQWPFISKHHRLHLNVSLLKNNGDRINMSILKNYAITQEDIDRAFVSAKLQKDQLSDVKIGSHIIFSAHINFREGSTIEQPLYSTTLQLIA